MPTPNEGTEMKQPTGLTVTRHLPVALTDGRKLALLDELSANVQEYNRLEKHKTEMVNATTKAMKHRKSEMDKISQTVAQGIEMQPVACSKEIDYIHDRITIRRIDTGAIIEDRALDEEDMKQ